MNGAVPPFPHASSWHGEGRYLHNEGQMQTFGAVVIRRGGPGSSVSIAIGYGLEVRGSNPGGGARLSAPVQTGPGAHPASCTMGTGSLPG